MTLYGTALPHELPHVSGSGPAPVILHGMIENPPPPGWYPDPDSPSQRYWDGTAWTEQRAPAAPVVASKPAWQQAWPITIGILVAVGVLLVGWQVLVAVNKSRETDCRIQFAQVVAGERVAVDSECEEFLDSEGY